MIKLDIQMFGGRGASSGSSKNGKSLQYFKNKGIKISNTAPKGWVKTANATTAPKGYSWYNNNKSLFSDKRRTMLVKDK